MIISLFHCGGVLEINSLLFFHCNKLKNDYIKRVQIIRIVLRITEYTMYDCTRNYLSK